MKMNTINDYKYSSPEKNCSARLSLVEAIFAFRDVVQGFPRQVYSGALGQIFAIVIVVAALFFGNAGISFAQDNPNIFLPGKVLTRAAHVPGNQAATQPDQNRVYANPNSSQLRSWYRVAADFFGMDFSDFYLALSEGKSIADLATEMGIDTQDVINELIESEQERIEYFRQYDMQDVVELVNNPICVLNDDTFGCDFDDVEHFYYYYGEWIDAAAAILESSPEALRAELETGRTIAEIATEKEYDIQELIETTVENVIQQKILDIPKRAQEFVEKYPSDGDDDDGDGNDGDDDDGDGNDGDDDDGDGNDGDDGPEFVTITAEVISMPNNDSGVGIWIVIGVDDIEYTIVASRDTNIPLTDYFRPTVDDEVNILAYENEEGSWSARSIFLTNPEIPGLDDEYWDESDDGDDDGSDVDPDTDLNNDEEFETRLQFAIGEVISAPSSEDGQGQWTIVSSLGEEIEVFVDQYTWFENTIPQIGDAISVDGFIAPNSQFIADEIELTIGEVESDFFDSEIEEIIGIVITAPDSANPMSDGETAEWIIETLDGRESVFASSDTTFIPQQPNINERVSVWGYETNLGFLAQEIAKDQFETGEIIVRLETDTISQTVASRYNLFAESTVLSSGGIYQFASFNPRTQHVNQIVTEMLNDSEIIWAERNVVGGLPVEDEQHRSWAWGVPTDSQYENQAAYEQINLDLAHTQYLGDGAIIAVLDTGVDLDHPELKDHLVQGWDMVADDSFPDDEGNGIAWGHGTHVSGVVARVAPNSKIMPIRVLDSNGRGDTFLLAYAIEWAVDHGADVINLSLGIEQYSWVLHEAVQYANENDVVVVAAAGNKNVSRPQYPAAFFEVIGVGAVDKNNEKAPFSNYGNWVSMAAPGVDIRSAIVGPEGDGYATWSGTSMAAPFVTGAAALVQQKLPSASSNAVTTILKSPFIQHANSTASNTEQNDQLIGQLLDVAAAVGISKPLQTEQTAADATVAIYLPTIIR